jgi:hypothetical protein
MFILDTDHISILEARRGDEFSICYVASINTNVQSCF